MPTGYAYFTIETAKDGYQAKFFDANDELVWLTEVYEQKAGARKAISMLAELRNKQMPPTRDLSR